MFSSVRVVRALRKKISFRFVSGNSNNGVDSPLRRLVKEANVGGEAVASDPELQWATEPYAAGGGSKRGEPRPAGDGTVLLFPGQGAQYVGMGRRAAAVPAAKDLYDEASEVLGWDVFRVCTEGPTDELEARLQPALLVTSLAALALAQEERPAAVQRAVVAAGFSLGEWAALVWGGALTFPAALRGVEARGKAMMEAAAARPGGMLTLWLAPDARLPAMLEEAAAAGPPGAVCSLANYLYPGCRVIAGDEQCLRWVEAHGARWGVRRSARVAVAGAWHCALLQDAARRVRAALEAERPSAPARRVLSAVDARPYRRAADVRDKLAAHVTQPVKWEQTLQVIYARGRERRQPLTLVLGPGAGTRHALRRVNARAWDHSLLVDI